MMKDINEFELMTEPVKMSATYIQYPGMDENWIELHRCNETHNHMDTCLRNSPFVRQLNDPNQQLVRDETIATFAKQSILACKLLETMDITGQNVERMYDCMLDHPYMHLLEETPSEYLGPVAKALREKTLALLGNEQTEMKAEGVSDTLSAFFDVVADSFVQSGKWTLECIRDIMKKLLGHLIALVDLVNKGLRSLVEKVIGYIAGVVYDSILSFVLKNAVNIGVMTICAGLAVAISSAMGFLAADLVKKMFKALTAGKQSLHDSDMIAEGAAQVNSASDAILIVLTFVGSVFALNHVDKEKVRAHCVTFTSIVAAGTAMTTLGAALLFLLPLSIQKSVFLAFAPEHLQAQSEVSEWNDLTVSLLRVRKCTNVLVSPEYYKAVTNQLAKAPKIMSYLKNDRGPMRTMLMSNHVQLVNLSSILVKFRNSQSPRSKPFGIHLFGPPGVGKTVCVHEIIRQALGYDPDCQTWSFLNGEDHWNGYIDQPIVIMDEWLTNRDSTTRQKTAGHYLALMSTSPFAPPMASNEDPAVGMKGTLAAPDAVITINNEAYDRVEDIKNNDALLRRRELLIELAIADDAIYKRDGTAIQVDMQAYAGNIDRFPWIKFRFHSPLKAGGTFGIPEGTQDEWLKWDDMITYVTRAFDEHKSICTLLASDTHVVERLTPQEMIDQSLREVLGIPSEPQSLLETMSNLLAPELTAEGSKKPVWGKTHKRKVNGSHESLSDPTSEHQHECEKCGKIVTHSHNGRRHRRINCEECLNKTPESNYDTASQNSEETPVKELDFTPTYSAPAPSYSAMVKCYAQYIANQGKERISSGLSYFVARRNLIGTLIVIMGVVKSIYNMVTSSSEELSFTAHSDGKEKSAKHEPQPRYKTRKATKMMAEGGDSTLTMQIDGRNVRGFGLRDRYVITYGHGFFSSDQAMVKKGDPITIRYKDCVYVEEFDPDCLILNDFDIARYQIRNTKFPQFANMTRNFLSNAELSAEQDYRVLMTNENGTNAGQVRRLECRNYSHGTKMYSLPHGYTGNLNSNVGDCGSIVKIRAGNKAGSILGIHVAGSTDKSTGTNCSLASPITREMLKDFDRVEEESDILSEELLNMNLSAEARSKICFNCPNPPVYPTAKLCADCMRAGKLPCPGIKTNCRRVFDTVKALRQHIVNDHMQAEAGMDEDFEWPELEGSNLRDFEFVMRSERIHLPTKTRYRPTVIQQDMPYPILKAPPALTPQAIVQGVQETLASDHVPVDEDLLTEIFFKIENQYKKNLIKHSYHRRWTMEEACGGIPSLLAGVDLSTSPGYPLVRIAKKPGKTSFIWYEGDQVCWSREFEQMVEEMMVEIEQGHIESAVFLGYLKDELRTMEKVQNHKTRIIYSGDLVATVAFRRLFGSLLVSFNNSGGRVPSSIGLNQYSHDMNIIYSYLVELGGTRFLAGDYKGFDKHFHPQFQKKAYDTLYNILVDGHQNPPSPLMWKAFVEHQTQAAAQIGPYRFSTYSNHMSGCFFTTIINCLVNEGYLRYAFIKLNKGKRFEEHIRMVCLGDDHVVSFTEEIEFNGPDVQRELAEIGQEYTGTDKSNVVPNYQNWEEITYLGSHPRVVRGLYTGAAAKNMIYQLTLWKSKNSKLIDQLKTSVEHASQWDQEFFDEHQNNIREALAKHDIEWDMMSYHECQRLMVERTSSSGNNYGHLRAEGDEPHDVAGTVFRFGTDTNARLKVKNFISVGIYQPFVGRMKVDGRKISLKLTHIDHALNRAAVSKTNRFIPVQGTWQGLAEFENKSTTLELTGDIEDEPIDVSVTGYMEYDNEYLWITISHTVNLSADLVHIERAMTAEGDDGQIAGLTTFRTDNVSTVANATRANKAHLSLNEQAMNISFGTDTKMYRNEYAWTTDMDEGAVIASFNAPHDILAMGDPTNIQNMPFSNYIYVVTDVSITIQLNGTPFQQGCIALYFYPLSNDGQNLQINNVTAAEHVLASPNLNSTVTLTVPFRYYRNALNTFASDEESLGTFAIKVLSPLRAVDAETVNITMYSSFPNAKFTIPRPVGVSYNQPLALSDYEKGFMSGVEKAGLQAECDFLSAEALNGTLPMTAEGQGQSTSTISNTYNISDVAGSIPIQGTNEARGGSQTVSPSTDVKADIVPMDNPPLLSGAMPVAQSFSGMAKAIGVEPTVGLGLGPEAMYHYMDSEFNSEELNLSYLLGKKCLLTVVTWDKTTAVGTSLWSTRFDSVMNNSNANYGRPNKVAIPMNLAVLNLATFWRADFELEFHCVRTHFHSGRLQFTVGYGAPSVTPNDRNVYYNTVMDFNGEVDRSVVTVKYNAATEFLRTYEGEPVVDPVQNYSLGFGSLFVANQLRAPTTVASSVEILVFITVKNAVMAVPRPIPFVQMTNPSVYQSLGPGPTDQIPLQAEGEEAVGMTADTPIVPNEEAAADDNKIVTSATTTATEIPRMNLRRCQIHAGAKFEYPIVHALDFVRRHAFITPQSFETANIQVGLFQGKRVHSYPVQPMNMMANFYAGWTGTIKYRLFICSESADFQLIDSVYFMPVMPSTARVSNAQLVGPDCLVNLGGGQAISTVAVPVGSSSAWKAQEVAYNIDRSTGWIDVSVPYQTHFNFSGLKQISDPEVPQNIGELLITSNITTTGEARTFIAQAVGDDFKYGYFRPPVASTFAGCIVGGTPPTTGSFNFGGFAVNFPTPP